MAFFRLTHNKEHVRNDVVQSKSHKSKRRPPNRHDLAEKLSGGEGEEARQADQPVGANTTEEDLMPLWNDDLGFRKGLCLGAVSTAIKDTSISDNQSHDEERAGKVAPERDKPMHQHLPRGDSTVQAGDGGEHEGAGTEVRTSQDDGAETKGENDGSDHADESWSIGLEPGR